MLTENFNLRLPKMPILWRWLTHSAVLLLGYQVALNVTTRLATGSF